jgi:ComF family protein
MPLRQLLLPARCVFCRTACRGNEADICGGCLADLPWHKQLFAAPPKPLQLVAAPLEYAFPVDAALKSFKFRRRLEYGPAFAELLCRILPQLPADIDALLPMPLHWQRQALRGFNQADELVRVLRRRSGLPILRSVRRIRATSSQSGLNAAARRQNLRDAFQAKENIDARHVLIVDDVITTGESCRQLASTVLGSGAGKVSAMSVARTTEVLAGDR